MKNPIYSVKLVNGAGGTVFEATSTKQLLEYIKHGDISNVAGISVEEAPKSLAPFLHNNSSFEGVFPQELAERL